MYRRYTPYQHPGDIHRHNLIGRIQHPSQQHRLHSNRGRAGFGPRRVTAIERQQDQEYNWQAFQNEERHHGRPLKMPPLNKSPPKTITTIRLDAPAPSSSGPPKNFCASWLAKNPSLLKRPKRIEEIVVEDESFREETKGVAAVEDDEIEVIAEKITPKKEEKTPEKTPKNEKKKTFLKSSTTKDDADDSIIVIGEFPHPKKTMTQSNNTMIFQTDSFWTSKPTSSTSKTATSSSIIGTSISPPGISSITTTTIIQTSSAAPSPLVLSPQNRPLMKILDGFSKDCTASKRGVRRWNKLKALPKLYETPESSSSTFTICSYNVLCQKTIERTNYLYRHLKNEPHFLEWNHRWKGLQEELPTFNADILALQEVQADHFLEHFEPFMKKYGYVGIYKQKFGTAQKDDGCAIFYRPLKFDRVDYKEVNYFISPDAISNRENIAQILALRCVATGEVIIVANTHLLFNEERGDVKLAQLVILFAEIKKMRNDIEAMAEYKDSIPPVLVMGDFNMEPNSKVYEFVVNGRLYVEGQYVRTMSGQSYRTGGRQCSAAEFLTQDAGKKFQNDGTIRHPFEFLSAYHNSPDQPAVIPDSQRCISTFHKDAAAPDFIFYTKEFTRWGVEKLQLLERFELPTFNTLSLATPWPNKHVPSDHLPIMAKFELIKDSP